MNDIYLSNEEKFKYLNKINKFYKYDSDIINQFMNKNIKIFENGSNNKKQKLTNNEIESLFILSKKTIKFMDDFSIDYWLDSGSLLGAMRDVKMIKWDDDIDLIHSSALIVNEEGKLTGELFGAANNKIHKRSGNVFWNALGVWVVKSPTPLIRKLVFKEKSI